MKQCECCMQEAVATVEVLTVHGPASVLTCVQHAADTLRAATLLGAAPRLELFEDLSIKAIMAMILELGIALGPNQNLVQLKAALKLWEPKLSI